MAEDYSYPVEDYLLLGKIVKAHGLRGEVKLFTYSGQPENIESYKELHLVHRLGNLSPPLAIEKSRAQGKFAIVKLATINDRDLAEGIEGRDVLLARTELPDTQEDEYYWHQFEGKLVVDHNNGKTIGRVDSLFNNGAQDILVVKRGEEEFLIPVTKDIVVRESKGELFVNPPPGLLELNSGSGK